ncbi:MAG: TRAP transporter small permease subunit [Paracoccaceae bacterium]|nr:TRAP transporter small permease subunit [Paracoccaceae bacterium]MDG1739252.1 TRAP transporter small permease subunit [Paracoccaceae bacterium]MDG2257590.1 TRAP transporter small permease subunit [Paracoccaceae bacterium]
MLKEDSNEYIAEEVSVAGAFHLDGVNTPPFLSGRLLTLWNAKLKLQRLILLASGVALTLLIFVQVVTRYVFGISIFGIEELASFTAVIMYFFGATHGAWERGHISASLIELILPAGRARLSAELLTAVLTVFLSAWMSVWAWKYLAFVVKRGTVSLETDIPMYAIVFVIPFCLSLMTFYFCVELLMRAHALKNGDTTK